jgi:hypothetical protein
MLKVLHGGVWDVRFDAFLVPHVFHRGVQPSLREKAADVWSRHTEYKHSERSVPGGGV